MVSTKWFQGVGNIEDVIDMRNKVLADETSDIYDEFAFNGAVYDDGVMAGTGRLIYRDGKYIIDKLCVAKEFRNNHYGDLLVRMLVRKAVTIGAQKTYANCPIELEKFFENIGFINEGNSTDGKINMVKIGDVGGHCCGK